MNLFQINKEHAPPPTGTEADRVKLVIKELREGGHKQITGSLREGEMGDCYCFEGIFAEVFRRESGRGHWIPEKDWWYFYLDGDKNEHCVQESVWKWFGMPDSPLGTENDEVLPTSWCELNDGDGDAGIKPHTFGELAQVLEEWLS